MDGSKRKEFFSPANLQSNGGADDSDSGVLHRCQSRGCQLGEDLVGEVDPTAVVSVLCKQLGEDAHITTLRVGSPQPPPTGDVSALPAAACCIQVLNCVCAVLFHWPVWSA
jgi:hypothetical protein